MDYAENNNSFNALQIIRAEFPALTYSLKADTYVKQLFKAVQNLSEYTKEQLRNGNEEEVEHCYRTAFNILQHGSNIAKVAIENVFVFGVSQLLEASFSVPQQARKQFLLFFKKEYSKQICNSLP